MTASELKRWRRLLGIAQTDLAHALGVSKTAVWRWEHDSGVPAARLRAVEGYIIKVARQRGEAAFKAIREVG